MATATSRRFTEPVGLNDVAEKLIIPVEIKSKSLIVEPRAVIASAMPSRSPETSLNFRSRAERLTEICV